MDLFRQPGEDKVIRVGPLYFLAALVLWCIALAFFHCLGQLLLQSESAQASVIVAPGLSCPAAHGILVPRPGIEPLSPALEGRFLTTGPPGKPPGESLSQYNWCPYIKGKFAPANAEDLGSIPGSGRCPGGGRSNPLQCCSLENPMDRGAWRARV